MSMAAPFPWFGGKSRAADLIWQRFGDVANYVEPFAGSLAVLLARPSSPKTETVNDLDAYLANFWRALAWNPEATAEHANWPVSEADLLSRHRWLVQQTDFRSKMLADPHYYDPKIAGWWVWGLCSWIGSGWCVQRGDGDQPDQLPHQRPHLGDAWRGINRKRPHLGAWRGINRKRPHLGAGRGINRKRPHLGAGRADAILAYFSELSARLARVRVCCGDWTRVLGDTPTIKHGLTGVVLDPPYDSDLRADCYSVDTKGLSAAVRDWAVANGDNPLLRVALCGYEGEHEMPEGWECVPWKSRGGYGSQSDGRGRANAKRERIWFSPHCLQDDLFSKPKTQHKDHMSAQTREHP